MRLSSGGAAGGRRPLLAFVLLTFGLTWAVWLPRSAGVDTGVWGRLSTWAPAVAALLLALLLDGRSGARDLLRRLVQWRVGWRWYAVVLLGPAVFAALVAGLAVLLGEPTSGPALAPFRVPATSLLLFLLLLTLTDGVGEELAWRGFALPRLLERHDALVASLVLGVVWGLWHLPLLVTAGSALEGHPWWLLLVDITAKSVLFTWVFLHTGGSVLVAALLHGVTNLFAVSPVAVDGDLTLALVAAALKWLLVGVLLLTAGRALVRRRREESSLPA